MLEDLMRTVPLVAATCFGQLEEMGSLRAQLLELERMAQGLEGLELARVL
jgi:hypothetical protein